MQADDSQPSTTGFRLTGRMVLLILLAFFGVVVSVNVFMAYVAINTFSGLQSQRPYETGIGFNRTLKSAGVQEEQHWQVTTHYERMADGRVSLKLSLRDKNGQPVDGTVTKVSLLSPVNAMRDVVFDLTSQGAGDFTGMAVADAGQWDLVIEVKQGHAEVFRSVSRVSLR
jgi:nitrogen fixation protein FixH